MLTHMAFKTKDIEIKLLKDLKTNYVYSSTLEMRKCKMEEIIWLLRIK